MMNRIVSLVYVNIVFGLAQIGCRETPVSADSKEVGALDQLLPSKLKQSSASQIDPQPVSSKRDAGAAKREKNRLAWWDGSFYGYCDLDIGYPGMSSPEPVISIKEVKVVATQFLKENRPQEALWAYSAYPKKFAKQAARIKSRLVHMLQSGSYVVTDMKLGGTTPKKVLRFRNGKLAVFKKYESTEEFAGSWWRGGKGELAAERLDSLFKANIVPTTVERRVDGELGTVQDFIRETVEGRVQHVSAGKFRRMKVFDYVAGNADRKAKPVEGSGSSNFLVLPFMNWVVAIDNGAGFREHTCGTAKATRAILAFEPDLLSTIRSRADTEVHQALEDVMAEDYLNSLLERFRELQGWY